MLAIQQEPAANMAPKAASKAPSSRSSAKPPSTKGKPTSRAASKAPVSSASASASRKRTADEADQDTAASPSSNAPASKKAKKTTASDVGGAGNKRKGVPEAVHEENEDEGPSNGDNHKEAEVGMDAEEKEDGQDTDVSMKADDSAEKPGEAENAGQGTNDVAMSNGDDQAELDDEAELAKAAAKVDIDGSNAPKRTSRTSIANGKAPAAAAAPPSSKAKPKHRAVAALASGSGSGSDSGSGSGSGTKGNENVPSGKKGSAKPRASVASSAGGPSSSRRKIGLELAEPAEHIRPARTLLIWGNGDMGQLGLGVDATEEISRPRAHKWFDEAIKTGKLGGEGAGVEQVAIGGLHSLIIDEKGRIWSWGVNDNGALGRITSGPVDPTEKDPRTDKEEKDPRPQLDNEELEAEPTLLESLVKEGFRAVRVVAGDSISVAIDDKGELRYWGSFRGNEGLLGFAGEAKAIQFMPTGLPKNALRPKVKIVGLAAGTDHVLLLSNEGKVYAMGDGAKAQLGRKLGSRNGAMHGLIPEPLGLRDNVIIAAGSYHSFAAKKDGTVFGWGFNAAGQTGVAKAKWDKGWEVDVIETPQEIDALSPDKHNGAKVISISAGDRHSLFLLSDGSVWGCGRTIDHEVGLAEDHPAMTAEAKEAGCIQEPVQIFFPPPPTEEDKNPAMLPFEDSDGYRRASSRIISISAGTRHSLAITAEGRVYSWGSGVDAQLGLGPGEEGEEASVPTLVIGKAVTEYLPLVPAAGGQHCIILAQKKAAKA